MKYLKQGLWFCLLLLPLTVFSAHIVGSTLSYKYIRTNSDNTKTWQFDLVILRDCNGGGAPFDYQPEIGIYRGTVLYGSFKILAAPVISKIWTDCPLFPEPNVCFEKGVFQIQVTLPHSANSSYFIVYQRCCFSASIRNLIAPAEQGITVYTELTPSAMSANNSSPVFENIPPLYTTRLGGVWFQPQVQNQEGNLLKFRLAAPPAGGGVLLTYPDFQSCAGAQPTPPCGPPFDSLIYIAGHSGFTPFASNDAIDELTGLFTVKSNYVGLYLVGIMVDEYLNGIWISSTPLQFTIVVADGEETCFFYTLGADDIKNRDHPLRVSPVPATDQVTLQLVEAPGQALSLRVYNAQGQLQHSANWSAGDLEMGIDLDQWPAGLYYAVVEDAKGVGYRRTFVKK